MKTVQSTFRKLIGSPDEFALEERIFHSVCLLTILVMAFNVVSSFVMGLPETGWICLALFLTGFYIYYLTRIQSKFVLALTLAGCVLMVLFSVNYFYSAGMVGSSLLSFSITLFLLLITAPARHSLFWVAFNVLVVLGLLTVEYLHPELIVEKHQDRLTHTLDLALTYLVTVVFLYFGTLFFTRAYKRERKRVEERSVVLERLNEEKNKLFSIVSHDLQSPLASVQHYLEVLKEIELEADDRKMIETQLMDGVNYTQEMLYNLLSWSTTQMSGTKVSLTTVNVSSCLQPIMAIFKPLLDNKAIRQDFRVDLTLHVLADHAMLQLIVRNLVGNAIKFTPTGGSITVETTRLEKTCLITVKDTGLGIPDEEKSRIFSLKAQPTYGTNKEKGVGLGLFLCKEYAEAQNGKLWYESTEGVGTTFYLELPLGV